MKRRILAPTMAWLALAALVASGCSTAGASSSPGSASPSGPTGPAATGTAAPHMDGGLDLLILQRAGGTTAAGYDVIDAASGRSLFTLSEGALSGDWQTLVTVTPGGATTRVLAIGAEGGDLRGEISVPGAWSLPVVGVGGRPSGLSPDGSLAVLTEAPSTEAAAGRTRFAIVPTSGSPAPRFVTLDGAFSYDALSPNGSWLYLIEHLPGADPAHYVVRRLNTATGKLQADPIVDKLNADEQMSGYPVAQQPGAAGWIYTVYRGRDGAFVHALDTADGIAVCIDLPSSAAEDATTGAAWGLALDPSGSLLYAANPALDTISQIGLADFSVHRTGTLASLGSMQLAKFENARSVGGRVAISPDGSTLYVLEARGIRVLRVTDLATTGRLGVGTAFRGVAAGVGSTVYAIDDAGRVVVVDAVSGAIDTLGDTRYASIVAVVPIR